MHCYGNLLYFTTCLLAESYSGKSHYRPEMLYFWIYFAGMNGIWFVVPGCEFSLLSSYSCLLLYVWIKQDVCSHYPKM